MHSRMYHHTDVGQVNLWALLFISYVILRDMLRNSNLWGIGATIKTSKKIAALIEVGRNIC